MIGPYRRRLLDLYAAEATRQSLLVESIHGMRTIKALNMQPRRKKIWNDAAAGAIRNYFKDVGLTIALITNALSSGFMEKILAVTVVVAPAPSWCSVSQTISASAAWSPSTCWRCA